MNPCCLTNQCFILGDVIRRSIISYKTIEQFVFTLLVTVPDEAGIGMSDTALITVTSQTYLEARFNIDLTTTNGIYDLFPPLIINNGN